MIEGPVGEHGDEGAAHAHAHEHDDGAGFELGDLGDETRLDWDVYGVVPVDDELQEHGRLVEPFDVLDLRDELDHELPPCDEGETGAWLDGVDRTSEGWTEPVRLGVVYPSGKGIVLARSMPIAMTILPWIDAAPVTTTPPTLTGPCPARTPIRGRADYSTSGYPTRKAARGAADTMVVSRATTDAGLIKNGSSCPAGCTRKIVKGIRIWRTRTTHVSVFYSAGWGAWRYRAEGTYWWWAILECY